MEKYLLLLFDIISYVDSQLSKVTVVRFWKSGVILQKVILLKKFSEENHLDYYLLDDILYVEKQFYFYNQGKTPRIAPTKEKSNDNQLFCYIKKMQ